jgi:uncharacterized protein YndB with AHSA1/START domain
MGLRAPGEWHPVSTDCAGFKWFQINATNLLHDGIDPCILHATRRLHMTSSTTSPLSTDRIERSSLINTPVSRVWRALTNAEEFGGWFGVALKGKNFVAGQPVQGNITIPGFEHVVFEALVERVEPEKLFSYRWHPYAVDPAIDYSKEPTTLVEFTLKDAGKGTLLTVVESGFDKIPVARRAEAIRMNTGGWEGQLVNIQKHVAP